MSMTERDWGVNAAVSGSITVSGVGTGKLCRVMAASSRRNGSVR